MTSDDAIRTEINGHFLLVHINVSKENKNTAAMEQLGHPEKLGYPVLLVLAPDLEVLHTQESGSLEDTSAGRPGHNAAKVLAFLRHWDGHS